MKPEIASKIDEVLRKIEWITDDEIVSLRNELIESLELEKEEDQPVIQNNPSHPSYLEPWTIFREVCENGSAVRIYTNCLPERTEFSYCGCHFYKPLFQPLTKEYIERKEQKIMKIIKGEKDRYERVSKFATTKISTL